MIKWLILLLPKDFPEKTHEYGIYISCGQLKKTTTRKQRLKRNVAVISFRILWELQLISFHNCHLCFRNLFFCFNKMNRFDFVFHWAEIHCYLQEFSSKSVVTGPTQRKLQHISIRPSVAFEEVAVWSHTFYPALFPSMEAIMNSFLRTASSCFVTFYLISSMSLNLFLFKWDMIFEEKKILHGRDLRNIVDVESGEFFLG